MPGSTSPGSRARRLVRWIARWPWFSSVEHHIEEVLTSGSVALFLKVAGAVLSFGFNIVLARVLGATGAGVYYLAITVTTIGSVVGRLGLDNASLRYIAAYAAAGEWEDVHAVYRGAMWLSGLTGAGVAVALYFLAPWISGTVFSEPHLLEPLRFMLIGVVPHCFLVLHTEILKGLKRIRDAMLLQGFGVPLLGIPLLLALGLPFGIMGAAASWVIGAYLVAAFGRYLWRRATPPAGEAGHGIPWAMLLRTSLPLLLVSSMYWVMSWTDTIVVGMWRGSAEVGIYGVVSRTASLLNFLLLAVSSIAAPKFSVMYAEKRLEELGHFTGDMMLLLGAATLPLAIVFVSVPGLVLRIFGAQFATGGLPLAVLTVGQFVNVVTGPAGYLLMMTGHERDMFRISLAVAALNVGLNVLLVPRMGILGAALATGAALAVMNIIATVVATRRLSIRLVPSLGG